MESVSIYRNRYNEFTRELLLNYGQSKGNIVLSPFSILTLLCMAADSTDTETRDEIIKVVDNNIRITYIPLVNIMICTYPLVDL